METALQGQCRVALVSISILPTRHGNSGQLHQSSLSSFAFRSYLRGMETTDDELKELFGEIDFDPTYEAWKLCLTSRNGPKWQNFDPTYEAWKLHMCISCVKHVLHFDPTYEAWKRVTGTIDIASEVYFDPTYEAWKPTPRLPSLLSNLISILPTRHGNWEG